MILDAFNQFSDAQAVTATAISTNVIDLAPLGNGVGTNTVRDIGAGEDIYLVVLTKETATAAGAATLNVTLESDDNAGLTSPTVHFSTGPLALAAFGPAGAQVAAVKLPNGNYERYLGVRYTVGTGPLTAGKFDAFLTKDVQSYRPYAVGSTIV
jgi:hypothetical protein